MRASSVGIATCASFATCCRADAFSRQQRQQQAAEVWRHTPPPSPHSFPPLLDADWSARFISRRQQQSARQQEPWTGLWFRCSVAGQHKTFHIMTTSTLQLFLKVCSYKRKSLPQHKLSLRSPNDTLNNKVLNSKTWPRSRCCQQECQLEFVTSPVMTKRSMRPLIQMLLDGIGRKGIWWPQGTFLSVLTGWQKKFGSSVSRPLTSQSRDSLVTW